MSIDLKLIGNKIRKERILLDLTLEELAEILDLSPSYMGLIERGQRGVSIETLYKLSTTLNVTTDYLLSPADEKACDTRLSCNVLYQKILTHIKKYNTKELKFLLEFIELKNKHDSQFLKRGL
ncbi:transcriptional regulator, XRE family [Alkaliphilus metalliredigens QYMF]|uniref:Transcriptional regulator, XRE family n=1 Tax=Alkaliphilus metalliredigens (strain QYMF) TaxID=293826 RepID=A6TLB0_ALKMQ|nr:helix-turn-helix transcriptional regulator [Alkaliphilus metalliredigens]ABR46978.1 transcriptional regulator, XRE family [Alkaliphilus metalliredigens QYMF]